MPRQLILIAAVGSSGDVHPPAALGQELRRRGHDVVLMASAHFEPLVRRLGLGFEAIASQAQYRAALDEPDLWHPRRAIPLLWQMVHEGTRAVYAAIERRAEPGRTLLVATTLGLGARLAQEKLGLPLATLHLAPACFLSAHRMPVIDGLSLPQSLPLPLRRGLLWLVERLLMDPVCAGDLNRYRRELGLPSVRRIGTRWMHSPDRVIALFPEWFAAPQPDWPAATRLTGFPLYDEADVQPLDAALEAFLAEGPPPIVFTPGSAMSHAQRFFANAVETCRRLGRRGLLLTPHRHQLPAGYAAGAAGRLQILAGVAHADYAPLSRVLPRAAALVHHGGIGTCSQALAAGRPQLVTPFAYDQFDNADRVERLGVGQRGSPVAEAQTWSDALRHLLASESVTRRCAEVSAAMATPQAVRAQACDLIEALARRDTSPAAAGRR